ncbi:MAG: hypothetical protein KDC71_20785, partial [Acidobacteria bacterium]|nr:hypothetical protein [Acidobacteriota bacterium]
VWTVPASPTQGQSVQWYARVQNLGSANAASGSRTGLYINGSFIGDIIHGSIAAGASAEGSVAWTPSTSGSFSFQATADRLSAIAESNETNNSRTETVTVNPPAPQPDLYVQDIWTVPASPVQGQSVQVFARTQNSGSANAASSRTGLYVNGSFLGDIVHGTISGGGSAEGSVNWTPSSSGTFSLQATADRLGAVGESNETNNSRTENVTVNAPSPQPDLIVQSVWITPANPQPGTTVTAYATIKNQGSVRTPVGQEFFTNFYLDGTYKSQFLFFVMEGSPLEPIERYHLQAGESFTGSANFTWPNTGSSHTLIGYVDFEAVIAESNEGNNSNYVVVESKPDLIVEDVWTSPATPTAGQSTQWFARVKNVGAATAPASVAGIFVNDVLQGNINVSSLALNGTQDVSVTWTPPNAGSYSLRAEADRTGLVNEAIEVNNSRTETVNVVAAPPDLVVTNLSISPASPTPGSTVTVTVGIQNTGSGNTPNGASIRTGIYLDSSLKNSFVFSNGSRTYMLAGETFSASRTFTWPNAGSYTLRAVVDDLNAVSESNETNNERTQAVGTIGPDLLVEDVWSSPSSPEQSYPVTWFARVRNTGNAPVPSGAVTGVYVAGSLRGDFNIGGLAVGATMTGSVNWTPTTNGTVSFSATADRLGVITELNESNNTRSETITILTPQPKPDLVVTSIYLNPAFPTAGQTVQATINIQNTGSVATPLDIEVETGLFVDSETSPRTSFIFLVWEGTPQEPIERLRMHAGETFSDTVSFIWPNDANAHTVRAKIDYPAQIVESNENNNEYSISVSQAPDLSVQDIWINPDPTIVSQVTQVSARVRNLGNVNAPASNTRFTLGGQTLNAATPAIAVGQTADVSVSWTPSTAGSIAVQAVADSANAIAEQNESNNARTENFTVNALPNVDLVVSSMILTPQYPTAGQTVNASITIQNVGTVSSQADGEIFTGLFLDNESNPRGQFLFLVIEGPPGEPIDRTRIHPGETYSDTISFVWPNDANAHSVKAWVDYPGTIVETDNNNNTLIRNVLSAPDLLVQDIVLNPDPTTVGLSTQLTAVVRNAGNLTAPAGTILRFNAGGQVLDVTTPAISPNQSVNVATSWTPVTAGTNSLSATADATGILTEQSENNNSRTESTNVNNVPNVDLVISAFNVSPASPNAGSTVTAYITVKNQGSVATPHETEIETALYLDGASTLTTSFIVEFIEGNPGEPISRFHLRAGESFYGSVTFTWPAGNSHSLLAKVDAPETISEIVENNNTATLNVSQPDLVLSDLVINPSAPQAGNSVQIGATITNQGAVSSGTPLRVEAKINGVSLQVLSLEQNGSPINLGPGQSHTFTFTTAWVPPSSGAYAVELKADPTNTVAESNEQNNTLTQNVTVGQNTGPDLVVSDLIFSPNAPLVGEGVQIEARIENIGLSSATGPIALRLSIDGSPSALETIQDSNGNPISLAAGATTSHHFVVIWSVPDANPHSFTVLVDPNQTIPESNESNNERSETLTATANIVDLVMTDIRTVPETLTVGNPVQVYATLKNRGDLATPAGVLIEVGLAINGTASGVFQVLQPDGVTPKSLAPGESFEGLISPNWMPTQGGTFSLLVTADLNQAVTEYDETNNQFSRTVEVENDLPPISGIISPANLNSGWNAEDPLPEVFDATLQSALAKSYGPEPFVLQPAQSPRGSHTQIWGIGKSVISDTDLQGSIPTHVYAVFEWSLDATKKFRNSKHNIFVVPFPDHLRGTQSPFRYDQRQRAVIQTAKSWTQTGENVFYQTEGDNFAAFVFVPQSELEKGGVASVPNQATAISHNIVMSDLLQTTDANNNRLLNISYLDANGNQSVLTAQFFDRLGRGNGAHRIGSHAPTSADFNKMGVNHEGLLDALGRPTKSPSGLFISDTFSAQSGVGRYTKFAIGKSRTSVFQESQSFWSNSSNYTATGFGPNGNENHQYIQMLGNDGQNSYVETVYEPDSRGRVVAVLPAGELGHQIGSLRYSRTHYTIIPAPTLFFDNVNDLPAELRQARMNHVWRGQAPGGQVQALIFARIAVNPDGLVNAFFEQEEDSPASLIVNNVSPDVLQNWGLEIRYLNQAPSTIQDLKSSIIYLPFNNLQEHTAFINKNNGNSINIVTYQQYDRFNRLRAKYPPLALNLQSSSNGWSVELVPSNARYASLYSYNNKDQLIQVVEPDSGITKYKYNRRGQIRFSQNSMLAARGYWFETISDSQDRVVQTRIIQASEASIDNYVEQTPGAVSVVSESTSQFIFDAYSPDQEVLPFGPVIWPTVENLLEKYPFQSSISFGTPIGKLTQTNDAYSSERQYFDELGRVVCRVMIQKDLSEPQIFWAKYRRFDGAVEQTYYENADAAYGYEFDNWERLVRIWDLKPVSRRFNIFVGHKTSLNSTYSSSYAAIGPLVDEASGLNAFEPPIKWAEY